MKAGRDEVGMWLKNNGSGVHAKPCKSKAKGTQGSRQDLGQRRALVAMPATDGQTDRQIATRVLLTELE